MVKLAMTVLWPSFLTAAMADGFFFSMFDPSDLLMLGGYMDMPPIAAYTIGFFFFWSFGAVASMMSLYLLRTENPAQPRF